MENIKKHSVLIVVIVLVFLFVVCVSVFNNNRNYSLVDFGVQPLLKTDCSSVQNASNNSPVMISFNVFNVSSVHDQIKTLITKYNGHIENDSFNSYSYPTQTPSSQIITAVPVNISQDSSSIVVTFDKSQDQFLTDLSSLIKSVGGVNTGYSYNDGSQPQNGGYSAYTTCVNMMQSVQADVLQLEVFTKALKEEHNAAKISLLSQSIYNIKSTLQNDVNNMNGFFATSNKPSVSISINSLQK